MKDYKKSLVGTPDEILTSFKVTSGKSWGPDFQSNRFKYHIKSQDPISQNSFGISHTFGWGNSEGNIDASLRNTTDSDIFVTTTTDISKNLLYIRFIIQGKSINKVLDLPISEKLIAANSKRMIYLSHPKRKSIIDFLSDPDFKFYTGENINSLFDDSPKKTTILKNEERTTKVETYWKEPEPELRVAKSPYSEDIKKLNDTHMLISAVGDEPWYRDQVFKKLKAIHPNMEVVVLDCEELSEPEVFSKLLSRDLFTSKRIFLIKNFIKIKKIEFFTEKTFKDILLLDSEKSSKSKAYSELISKTLNIDCSRPKPWFEESDALGKILGYLKMKGYTATQDTARYIYSQFGYNLYKILSEMEKLVIYKGETQKGSTEITPEDVDKICVTDIHFNIFDIIDKIIAGKKKDALNLVDAVFRSESSPSILLINLWYTHFENLLYLKSTSKKENELNTYIRMPPMVIQKKLIPQSKALQEKKILESMRFLTDVDNNIRKGCFDARYYLDNFILEF